MGFVADNIAYHSVFGVNENFFLGMCCEKCSVPQSKFKQVFEEDAEKLRSPASCISNVGVAGSGVKSVCRLKTSSNRMKILQCTCTMIYSREA